MIGSFGASFRLEGLIVGKGSIGSRLGYDRSEMKGPYLLKKLFGRLLSSARFVDWGRVVAIEEGKIFVDQPLEEMRPPEILTARRSG
jgi:hypothetical protein